MMSMQEDSTNLELSSLVDGEVSDEQAGRLVSRLCSDPELRARWERYHLIGESLKNNLPDYIDPGFAGRVSQALADEPTVLAPKQARKSTAQGFKRVAGLAVAASVATLAVLGVQYTMKEDPAMPMMARTAQMSAPQLLAQLAVSHSSNSSSSQPLITDPHLNRYLVNHSEYAMAAGAGMQGMLPYARIVSYRSGQ